LHIKFPTGQWGKIIAIMGNFHLQKTKRWFVSRAPCGLTVLLKPYPITATKEGGFSSSKYSIMVSVNRSVVNKIIERQLLIPVFALKSPIKKVLSF